MGDIFEKMGKQVPYGFFGLDVLLSAYMTVFTINNCVAIQAIVLLSFIQVAQNILILLKIAKFARLIKAGII
jgi:hypothetical protein